MIPLVRCKNCKKACRDTTDGQTGKPRLCWDKWGLCGRCAISLHPKEYVKPSRINLINKKIRYEKQRRNNLVEKIAQTNDILYRLDLELNQIRKPIEVKTI